MRSPVLRTEAPAAISTQAGEWSGTTPWSDRPYPDIIRHNETGSCPFNRLAKPAPGNGTSINVGNPTIPLRLKQTDVVSGAENGGTKWVEKDNSESVSAGAIRKGGVTRARPWRPPRTITEPIASRRQCPATILLKGFNAGHAMAHATEVNGSAVIGLGAGICLNGMANAALLVGDLL